MDELMTPEKLAEYALSVLRKKADPRKAEQGRTYFKEKVSLLGISAPDLKRIAGECFQKIKSSWTVEEALAFCDRMLPEKELEAKAVSLLVLGRFVKSLKKDHVFQVKKWILRGDCGNWAMIDLLCPAIVSPLLEAHPELRDEILSWTESPNRWLRRGAAVSFIKPARLGRFIPTVHEIALRLFADTDDLVRKANGWLLRESGKTDMARLEKFLLAHGPSIPRTTLRYAIERFPEKKRRELLVKTRRHS